MEEAYGMQRKEQTAFSRNPFSVEYTSEQTASCEQSENKTLQYQKRRKKAIAGLQISQKWANLNNTRKWQ